MGFEPMYNGFAGRRVSHFATRAHFELGCCEPPTASKSTLHAAEEDCIDQPTECDD